MTEMTNAFIDLFYLGLFPFLAFLLFILIDIIIDLFNNNRNGI